MALASILGKAVRAKKRFMGKPPGRTYCEPLGIY
jgi:hypothetical protein